MNVASPISKPPEPSPSEVPAPAPSGGAESGSPSSGSPSPGAESRSSRLLSLLLGSALPRAAVPVGVLAAGWSLAAYASGDSTETRYLTLLAAGVLGAVAFLAPHRPRELTFGGPLAVLLLWVLPPGPTRGTALVVLLTALLASAAARAGSRPPRRDPGGPAGAIPWGWLLRTLLPAVVGIQLLFGSGALLGLGREPASVLSAYLGLPVVAGLAVVVLARYFGLTAAVAAALTAMILGAGLAPVALVGPVPALGLAALAAGAVLGDPRRVAPRLEGWKAEALRWSACAVLLLPLLAGQRTGALALAAGLTLALSRWIPVRVMAGQGLEEVEVFRFRASRWLVATPALAVLAAAALFPLRSWAEAARLLAWLPLTVPGLVTVLLPKLSADRPPDSGRRTPGDDTPSGPPLAREMLLASLALGLATALAAPSGIPGLDLPAPQALALPAALAALALPATARRLQVSWGAALLLPTLLAAAYPWLRPGAPAVALEILLPSSGWWSALVLAGVFLALLAALRLGVPATAVASAALLGLFVFAYAAVPRQAHLSRHLGGHTLDREGASLSLELPGERAGRLVLHSHLAHAGGIPAGTPVATVRLLDHRGRRVHWDLTAGEDTAEWAADRNGVEAPSPPPWLSHAVSDEEGLPFFGHRYRTVLDLGQHPADPVQPVRLEIERRDDLPPEVELALFHLEVRP